MKRKSWGLFLVSMSLILSITHLSLTGSVIGSTSTTHYYPILVGMIFFIGIFFLVTGRGLDAIIIPTGAPSAEEKRTERAYRAYASRGARFFLISGEIKRDEQGRIEKGAHTYEIYRQLRGYGIKPNQIKVEGRSRDTEENVEHSFRRLEKEGASRVGIASSKEHLDRFSDLIEEGKRNGEIPDRVKMYRLTTRQNMGERVYGVAAEVYHHIIPGKTPNWIKGLGKLFFR